MRPDKLTFIIIIAEDQMEEDNTEETPIIVLTQELLDSVAKVIAPEWVRVAGKLGYKEDEVCFSLLFQQEQVVTKFGCRLTT
jgi:hypothetical protein